jgi:hypothetical protein
MVEEGDGREIASDRGIKRSLGGKERLRETEG